MSNAKRIAPIDLTVTPSWQGLDTKIVEAIDEFAYRMKGRMLHKNNEGYSCSFDLEDEEVLLEELEGTLNEVLKNEQPLANLLDSANILMMLYTMRRIEYRILPKKDESNSTGS